MRRTTVLQARSQCLNVFHRSLVRRLADLEPGFRRVQFGFGQQALGYQFPGASQLRPGIVAAGRGGSNSRNVAIAGYLTRTRRINAKLGFRLAESAFSALEGQLQLRRIQPHQLLTGFDFLTNFNQDIADNARYFTANASLIRRYQRTRQLDVTVYRNALHSGGFNRDTLPPLPAPTTARSLPALGCTLAAPVRAQHEESQDADI